MKYYVIAGEASGDLHAANVIKELKQLDQAAEFSFTGGDLMEQVTGQKADIPIRDMAFMGFVDVLKNIGTIRKNFNLVKNAILNFRPDIVLLVDYPGFNLRMAKWCHQRGFKVDYYISPTVWAWKEGRVETIRQFVNRLFVILPFEKPFYAKHGMEVFFVGHPLIDAIASQPSAFTSKAEFIRENGLSGKPLVAVLPGSRVQEIERMLNLMLEVRLNFPGHEFVVAGASNLSSVYYDDLRHHNVKVLFNQTYDLMRFSDAGIIKSGTSTLESALLRLPQVVCYRGGGLSFAIGKRLVNVKYISLVNLIMDKPVVTELIQNDLTSENISKELHRLLFEKQYRESMLSEYDKLMGMLGGAGASHRVAGYLFEDVKKK